MSLRTDGTFVIYKIQHDYKGRWYFSNLDVFGYPPGFDANGTCWQRTGETGTFDPVQAREGLAWVRERAKTRLDPNVRGFRLVKQVLKQTTTVVRE